MSGRRTEWNRESRQKIAEIAEAKGIDRCEECGGTFGLAPAHRKRRDEYQSAEELAEFTQWLALCIIDHQRLDDRSQTTEEEKEQMFIKHRGI